MRDPKILVFRTGCSYRRRLESILQARGAIGVRCMEFGTLDGILGCVGADMGLTLLPAAVVERHASDRFRPAHRHTAVAGPDPVPHACASHGADQGVPSNVATAARA
ncbi:LysR substrate-binding domain-containing protein [Streptomyces cyaneus]|uniref:LysR substrate-binding domain-containing protein n=1 Tax=Streptomyces cyaneus TaxID=1904 RepID=UPI003CCC594C